MKQEDQYQQNKEYIEPQFEDSNYQIAMREDPLTTTQAIREELQEIDDKREARQAEKQKEIEDLKQKEIEDLKAELEARREAEGNTKQRSE